MLPIVFSGWTQEQVDIAIEWIEDILEAYQSSHLLFATVRILARYFDRKAPETKNSDKQAYLCAAIVIASKFYDAWELLYDEMVPASGYSYTKQELIEAELDMLCILDWKIKSFH